MTDTLTILRNPSPLTPLIGRDHELEILLTLLRGQNRLVTLTGIGGIGKTRLGHQAVLELEPEFSAGAAIVPLAEIRHAHQVPASIARLFGVNDSTMDAARLADIIGPESRLLMLDNLEQIPEIQPVIIELLEHLPQLTILATSQIPLDLAGEQLFPLSPMATNSDSDTSLQSSPAVELFLQRAKSFNPLQSFDSSDIRTIGEICTMLEGIPLAIELAAGRTSIMSPAELKSRLSDRLDVLAGGSHHAPHRQRTMRNAIAWSYDLLSSDDQRIFRYLGVFVGSLGLDAIEHTIHTLELTASAIDTLDSLVRRGFLHPTFTSSQHARYHMLETLREFALEQLREEGDEFRALLSHAYYVAIFTETSSPKLVQSDQEIWYAELDANRENIRAAAEWSLEHRPELTIRIIAAIWQESGYRGTSQHYIAIGRKAIEADLPDQLRARGWMGIGLMEAQLRHDHDTAEASLREAIRYARVSHDHYCETRAYLGLGTIAMYQERYEDALLWNQQAEAIAREHNDPRGVYSAQANFAAITSYQQDFQRSLSMHMHLLHQEEAEGHVISVARLRCNIGFVQNLMGDYQGAIESLSLAIESARKLGNVAIQLHGLVSLGESHMMLEQYAAAKSIFEEGITLSRTAGRPLHEIEYRTGLAMLEVHQGNWVEAVRGVPAALAVTSQAGAVLEICHCAGIVAVADILSGNRSSAAMLVDAVIGGSRTITEIDPLLADPCKEFVASIPADPEHPERIAYETGKNLSLEELALRVASSARRYLADVGTAPLHREPTAPAIVLTPRELEVLAMMAKGYTNAEIADEMFISPRTITTHCSNIFSKLEVKNRAAAVALALTEELV